MEDVNTYKSFNDVKESLNSMRSFYQKGHTRSIDYRKSSLSRLKSYLKQHEEEALRALNTDLGKAPFEGYATELGIIYEEINTCLRHLSSWSKPKRVKTSLLHFPSRSKVFASPLGVVLVLSPWNYPLHLALVPAIDALAAGNCVALKPSSVSTASSSFLMTLFEEVFPQEYCRVFPGSKEMNGWLMELAWNKIFFTGSPKVAHTILEAGAKTLTPVTLELGGKSPCIVDESAHLARAAQRIAWGKGVNAGQTCVAPDYLLVHESVADELVSELDRCFHNYYGSDILSSEDWPHIINERHFSRLLGLMNNGNPQVVRAFGGSYDASRLRIEPTCLLKVSLEDPIMNEEIFGPLLPVLTFSSLDEAFSLVRHFESPLACYVFTERREVYQRVIEELSFGGATINDVIVHIANNRMGFGGVGNSGMGAYHGKTGFDCFTHYKSTLKKSSRIEIPVRVPPFKDKLNLLRRFMS